MHPHDTPNEQMLISADDRAALLAVLPGVGKERPAIHAHAGAIYARLSMRKKDDGNGKTDQGDDDPDSIKAQLHASRRYAARIKVPVLYELDDTKSGLLSNRIDYRRLIELAEGAKISHVILYKADRLSRDDAEFLATARRLLQLGIEIHDTTLGRLTPDTLGFHAFLANHEVRAISTRTTTGMTFKAQGGLYMGRPMLGYRRTPVRGVLERDPVTGPLIEELFRRYAAGEGLRPLARWLNQATGLRKHPNAIGKLLKNPFYKGVIVFGRQRNSKIDGRYARARDEWSLARHNAPLVDDPTWNAVQARLALASNIGQDRQAGARFVLSGLMWCAACNLRMAGHHKATQKGTGEYVCGVCDRSRSLRRVERAVRDFLAGVPIGRDAIAAALQSDAVTAQDHGRARLAALDARLIKLAERRGTLTNQHADREITTDDYHVALAQTDHDRAKLRAQREELECTVRRTSALEASLEGTAEWLRGLESWTSLLDHATKEEEREVYRQCIARINFDPAEETLTVHWMPAIARLVGTDAQTITMPARRPLAYTPVR